jgi:prepilin-type N-terminal cleavage/methylation domain-containing protein
MDSRIRYIVTGRRFLLKTHRLAFTLIEVLVSVLILSTSIFYVMKIYTQNHAQAAYIDKRNRDALQDSLFLTEDAIRYNKEKKSAYDLLHDTFKGLKNSTRKNLKQTQRTIHISDPIKLLESEEGPNVEVTRIILKDAFSSSYYRFKISAF